MQDRPNNQLTRYLPLLIFAFAASDVMLQTARQDDLAQLVTEIVGTRCVGRMRDCKTISYHPTQSRVPNRPLCALVAIAESQRTDVVLKANTVDASTCVAHLSIRSFSDSNLIMPTHGQIAAILECYSIAARGVNLIYRQHPTSGNQDHRRSRANQITRSDVISG